MKKFQFRAFSLIIFFVAVGLLAQSNASRAFDQQLIEQFKNDSDFNYSVDPPQFPGFLAILFSLLGRIFEIIFYPFSGNSPTWVSVLGYTILIAVIIYVIIKALNLDVNSVFFTGRSSSSGLNLSEEELSKVDLENLLREALAKNDYRLSLRYIYLLALHQLSNQEVIILKPGKTSSDYLHEISDENIYQDFNRLNYYFEYGWYGEFPIDKQIFEKANNAYNHFLQQLK